MKILNFGSCNIDYVYSVPHFVKPGETISATKLARFPGGKGLNQSIAAARSGAKVYHAGCIGSDGLFLKETLESANVNTKYLKVADAVTGHAIIQVDENGENCIILHGGTNFMIEKEYIDKVLSGFDRDDIIILQNEINNIVYIIEKAYQKGMQVVLNPSPFHKDLTKIDLEKLAYIILNEVEASEFTGETSISSICEYFKKNYKNLKVVLTLGSKGSLYIDISREIFCPSYSVKAVDTTSAGDTYTGYFISAITQSVDIENTLKLATAASAIAVSRAGASDSIPDIKEVKDALKSLQPNKSNIWD